jgi:hypothetical protein
MPQDVYDSMVKYIPDRTDLYDLHHALVSRGDVSGMPLAERRKIHDPRNLWWVSSSSHASHANISDKRTYYRLLCERFGKDRVDAFINSFNWKSSPKVTVQWLEGE